MLLITRRVGEKIMRATGASKIWTEEKGRPNRWAGGTRMGADPKNSVVNEFCQTHDLANLFIVGSSAQRKQARTLLSKRRLRCSLIARRRSRP